MLPLKSLPTLIQELEEFIPDHQQQSNAVSASSVGWHIGHSLMAIQKMGDALLQASSTPAATTFNLSRLIILSLGRIPRGRGRAPDIVKPADNIDTAALTALLQKVRALAAQVENVPDTATFFHPVFGHLRKKQGIRFMRIHTHHHLAIIRDIMKQHG